MDDFAIRVQHVSKDFHYTSGRAGTIKSLLTSTFKNSEVAKKDVQHALSDVSFDIKKGEFFGIVGRNGSGKSTLLKMIAGIYQPNSGKIHVSGKLVPFIELGVGFNPELTGRENVYLNGALLGFSRKEIEAQYDEIVEFAELEKFMDQQLKNYSSGMQVRLAFSMAVRAKADVLLIDEVLAVGDADFQRKCFNYFKQLKKSKTTVIFISHDMSMVREYCDRVALINDSKLKSIGNPDSISQEYAELFITNTTPHKINSKIDDGMERWGRGDVSLQVASASIKGDSIKVHAKIIVNKDINRVAYGIHVIADDGVEVTAVNNRMIAFPDMRELSKGQAVDIDWEILNIFNDGRFTITLAFVDSIGEVLEWVNNATSFDIRRPERSTTAVLPPISVKFDIHEQLKGVK